MNQERLNELLLQSLEHERGGVKLYTAALACAQRDELRKEWNEYLEQTRTHVQALEKVCRKLGLDAERETPGRKIVRDVGAALVAAIEQAQAAGDPQAAQIVACECIVLAETKDHQNWSLLSKCAEEAEEPIAGALAEACAEVEKEEDEHLYHSKGWCRELWIQALGMEAVLPPPEEKLDVKSEIEAGRAKQKRKVA